MPAQLEYRSTDASVDDVIDRLKRLEGVMDIAKNPTREGVSGFIIFESAELAAAARNRVTAADGFELVDPGVKGVSAGEKKPNRRAQANSKRGKAVPAGDFFNGPSPSTMPREQHDRRGPVAAHAGRGRANGGEGRGRGAGGRGGEGRGRGGQNRQRPRTISAFVACVHGVAPSMTNDQVFQAFKHCGHIFDIKRSERLALVYFREADHVTEAIVSWNGKKLQDSESPVTVVNAGEMQLPVPPPPAGPPPGPPPHGAPLMMPPVPGGFFPPAGAPPPM